MLIHGKAITIGITKRYDRHIFLYGAEDGLEEGSEAETDTDVGSGGGGNLL